MSNAAYEMKPPVNQDRTTISLKQSTTHIPHAAQVDIESGQIAKPNLLNTNGLPSLASAFGPKPEAIYDGDYGTGEIKLRIGNGGAGQSGLIKGKQYIPSLYPL
ncbi:hypothetical protein N7478_006250 [Penicillium angulare]|uniref:uncharacterized protein n=1 Tax=Penicillium angulare TaxID=116970 RepID=UPI002542550A|nr:uncharacterized protein N7478_006250 [Penicillium angulare]KAJ5280878.1 hypothetical protein N7478_006250 [Penicillium angulare]